MEGGREIFEAVGKEAAQVIAGSALASGGFIYWTKARGWRLLVGAGITFGGGYVGYQLVNKLLMALTGEPMPQLSAFIAGTCTPGAIMALRKWARAMEISSLIGKRDG